MASPCVSTTAAVDAVEDRDGLSRRFYNSNRSSRSSTTKIWINSSRTSSMPASARMRPSQDPQKRWIVSLVKTWWRCWKSRRTRAARRTARRRMAGDSLSSLLCRTQGAQGWPRTCRRRGWTWASLRNAFTRFALTREKKEAGRIILTTASTYTTPTLLLVISPVLS